MSFVRQRRTIDRGRRYKTDEKTPRALSAG